MAAPLLNLRLPEAEAQALSRLAAEQGRTRSDLIREVLRDVLRSHDVHVPTTSGQTPATSCEGFTVPTPGRGSAR
jgi:hypothetical protein